MTKINAIPAKTACMAMNALCPTVFASVDGGGNSGGAPEDAMVA